MTQTRVAMLGTVTVGLAMLAMLATSSAPLGAQATATANSRGAVKYSPPRLPDGHPDLAGVWANNNITPLERPKELAGRQFLTDQEVATLKKKVTQLFGDDGGDAAFGDQVFAAALGQTEKFTSTDGGTGNYNQFWLVERDFDNRTALITDPPDGRVPEMTPQGRQREAAAAALRTRLPSGPEDRALGERCITWYPRISAGYNSYFQIIQSGGYVVFQMEMGHESRVIPMDGRPHASKDIRMINGDPRGHWEGDTLVVDTTNFSSTTYFRGASVNLHLIERFTRVGLNTLNYEVTVDDPTTWTKPWTLMIPMKATKDQIYEYACHEGNIGLRGILAGSRSEEREESARKGSR